MAGTKGKMHEFLDKIAKESVKKVDRMYGRQGEGRKRCELRFGSTKIKLIQKLSGGRILTDNEKRDTGIRRGFGIENDFQKLSKY